MTSPRMRAGVLWLILLALPLTGCVVREAKRPAIRNWNEPGLWEITHPEESAGQVVRLPAEQGGALQLSYVLGGDHGFIQMKKTLSDPPAGDQPITFRVKAQGEGTLEIKFVDSKGTTFGAKIPIPGHFADWTRITARLADMEYLWGGDGEFGQLAEFHLVASGQGRGTIWFDDLGYGPSNLASTFTRDPEKAKPEGPFFVPVKGPQIDPDAELPGIGFRQRRAAAMTPEDPGVLEWLKTLQDVSSPARQVLPTTAGDNQLQTFNNALVALAFLLKGERERAERILDFFAAATVRNNQDPTLQNFFYKGEARGFFQAVTLNNAAGVPAHHTFDPKHGTDRWMGDMAWLLFAYTYHAQLHGPERYREVSQLLKDLLVSWFTDSPKVPGGGYVRHGWRKLDRRLHEEDGHPEGNIDCYALFRLMGDEERAKKVRTWIEAVTGGRSQPLDVYTWRVLAYDGDRAELLDIPDFDLRYRKTVTVNGTPVAGPFGNADGSITNIWLDGLGHIACAYQAAGNRERGYFYANQFDALLMDSTLGGKQTRTLPYTANRQGGFDFDQSGGYISVAAWYLFAKNGFNPMTLKTSPVVR